MYHNDDVRVQLIDDQVEPIQFILSYLAEKKLNLYEATAILDKAKEVAHKHTTLDAEYAIRKSNHPLTVRDNLLGSWYQP